MGVRIGIGIAIGMEIAIDADPVQESFLLADVVKVPSDASRVGNRPERRQDGGGQQERNDREPRALSCM